MSAPGKTALKKTAAVARSLADNAAAAHEARVARLKLTGERAITRVRDLRERIEDDFLEIGQVRAVAKLVGLGG